MQSLDLSLDVKARASRSIAKRLAPLHHEAFNHAVENQAVIQRLSFHRCSRLGILPVLCSFSESDKVRDSDWRILLIKLAREIPHRRFKICVYPWIQLWFLLCKC